MAASAPVVVKEVLQVGCTLKDWETKKSFEKRPVPPRDSVENFGYGVIREIWGALWSGILIGMGFEKGLVVWEFVWEGAYGRGSEGVIR